MSSVCFWRNDRVNEQQVRSNALETSLLVLPLTVLICVRVASYLLILFSTILNFIRVRLLEVMKHLYKTKTTKTDSRKRLITPASSYSISKRVKCTKTYRGLPINTKVISSTRSTRDEAGSKVQRASVLYRQ